MSKLEECIDDIIDGFTNRTCPYNGDALVHRGTIAELAVEFDSEGWFRDDYSEGMVEKALSCIHQAAAGGSGVYITYVGPGNNTLVVPLKDASGSFVMMEGSVLDHVDTWMADGTKGFTVEHQVTGEQFKVTGNGPTNGGFVYVVDVVQGNERWLINDTGVGLGAIQRLRLMQGDLSWDQYIATLNNGRVGQFEVTADAEQAAGNRVLARMFRRHAAEVGNTITTSNNFQATVDPEITQVRNNIPWLQDAVLV
jgi:hypothetical protein